MNTPLTDFTCPLILLCNYRIPRESFCLESAVLKPLWTVNPHPLANYSTPLSVRHRKVLTFQIDDP